MLWGEFVLEKMIRRRSESDNNNRMTHSSCTTNNIECPERKRQYGKRETSPRHIPGKRGGAAAACLRNWRA